MGLVVQIAPIRPCVGRHAARRCAASLRLGAFQKGFDGQAHRDRDSALRSEREIKPVRMNGRARQTDELEGRYTGMSTCEMRGSTAPQRLANRVFACVLIVGFAFGDQDGSDLDVKLGLRAGQNVDSGIVVELQISVAPDAGHPIAIPAWALHPNDFFSGVLVLESKGQEMGRVDNQVYRQWRKVRSGNILLPPGALLWVKFNLSSTHEIFQYKMDKGVVDGEIVLHHELWPDRKVSFRVKRNGELVVSKEDRPTDAERSKIDENGRK